MSKVKNRQSGFSAVEVLVVIVVIAVIAAAGVLVYKRQNPSTKSVSDKTAQSASSSDKKSQPTTKPDSYAGWKTATLATTKISFKYPSTWTAKDDSMTESKDISDQVVFSGDNGFGVDLMAESTGHPSLDGPVYVYYAKPVTYLGQKGYLDYFSVSQDDNTVDEVTLSKSATDPMDTFQGSRNGATYNVSVTAGYATADGLHKGLEVAAAKTDANFTALAQFVSSAEQQ